MCFGTFHLGHGGCHSCKVVRSCRRESLKNLHSKREKKVVLRVRVNTIDRFGRSKAKRVLLDFLSGYKSPVSTYRLTKDFKKNYNVNISDSTILVLCQELVVSGLVSFKNKRSARYWFLS